MNDNVTKEAIESILRFLYDDLNETKSDSNSDKWIKGYIEGVKACINTINILKNRWKDKGLL